MEVRVFTDYPEKGGVLKRTITPRMIWNKESREFRTPAAKQASERCKGRRQKHQVFYCKNCRKRFMGPPGPTKYCKPCRPIMAAKKRRKG